VPVSPVNCILRRKFDAVTDNDCELGKVAWYVPFSLDKLISFTVVSTATKRQIMFYKS